MARAAWRNMHAQEEETRREKDVLARRHIANDGEKVSRTRRGGEKDGQGKSLELVRSAVNL